jgi:thiamine-phosphate pyrophosphorylase
MQSSFALPRVYPLTDVELSGLSLVEQVSLLCEGGASLVQLRAKQMPALQFYEQAKALAAHDGLDLIVNDRVDVALAAGIRSVHLGQDDMPPDAARRLLGPHAVIGYSTHSVEQALAALTLPIDYVAIGPIFETATKTDTAPALGLEGLRAVRRAVETVSLVAIGGITAANARDVIEAGADSVAVISAVLSQPDRIAAATRLLIQSLPPARQT